MQARTPELIRFGIVPRAWQIAKVFSLSALQVFLVLLAFWIHACCSFLRDISDRFRVGAEQYLGR